MPAEPTTSTIGSGTARGKAGEGALKGGILQFSQRVLDETGVSCLRNCHSTNFPSFFTKCQVSFPNLEKLRLPLRKMLNRLPSNDFKKRTARLTSLRVLWVCAKDFHRCYLSKQLAVWHSLKFAKVALEQSFPALLAFSLFDKGKLGGRPKNLNQTTQATFYRLEDSFGVKQCCFVWMLFGVDVHCSLPNVSKAKHPD